jgi:AcrR family transcriptional regulator
VTSQPGSRSSITRDERRQTLVDAAQELFSHKGYHATTVDDITRAAGVAKGTFYLYFDEKREVYYEVVRAFMTLVKEIGGSVRGQSVTPENFFERAEQAAHELMRVIVDNHELARLAQRESMGLDPELEAMMRSFYRELAEVEADNIRTAMKLGLIRPVNPLIVAYAHIGMVERVVLAILEAPADFPPPAQVVREVMQLAFEGLRRARAPTA